MLPKLNARHKQVAYAAGSIIATLLAVNVVASQFDLHLTGTVPNNTGVYKKDAEFIGKDPNTNIFYPAPLSIEMTSVEKTTVANRPVVHKLVVKNIGTALANNVTVTMTVSPRIKFESSFTKSPTCTVMGANAVSCKLGAISGGGQRSFAFINTVDREFGCNQTAKFAVVAQGYTAIPARDSFLKGWSTDTVKRSSSSSSVKPAIAVSAIPVSCGGFLQQ